MDLRDDISQAEYICLLAEALDAEELDDYNTAVLSTIAFNAPKQVKRWRWSSPDKAGTAPSSSYSSDPGHTIANVAMLFGGGKIEKTGNFLTYAKATGKDVAFRTQDGSLVNEDGEVVERTRDMIIVPWPEQEV